MKQEYYSDRSLLQSVVAVPFAIAVWVIVYCIAYIGLGFFDMARGLGKDWLQSIFRELFTPAVGGFVAIYAVKAWLSKAHLKHVFWAFSIPIFLFMIGLPLFIIVFMSHEVTFSWGEQIIRWLGGCATIVGAWLAWKQAESKRR